MGTNLPLIDQITGNASPAIKRAFLNPGMVFPTLDHDGKYRVLGFAMETIFQRVAVTDISSSNSWGGSQPSSDGDPGEQRPEGSQVWSIILMCKVDVFPDMANNHHILHGGCTAFLIDMCSSLAVVALTMIMKSPDSTNVESFPLKFDLLSQSLNVVYHSPAPVGDSLRIVCTTMPSTSESGSNVCVRTEIWSMHRHCLVASGVHTMMKMSTRSKSSISRL
ncbi:hypothetical protein J3R30DRAFT_1344463 [Lentinula aciculospora]|uniref:Thioesterase domain-containing protein n=1 Tax=Lentinula aciculospora TaxID=153920 RepID=A0A9W9APM9_9AGAR|nr:hypothetical protein J3R30DRAFT_1344463 [Lentinula aciculospora]